MSVTRILSKLSGLGFPAPEAPLLNSRDGLEFPWTKAFDDQYELLLALGRFAKWPVALAKNHAVTVWKSGREATAASSCQLVFFTKDGLPWIEADVDYFNPDMGVAPLVLHGIVDVGWLSLKRLFRK